MFVYVGLPLLIVFFAFLVDFLREEHKKELRRCTERADELLALNTGLQNSLTTNLRLLTEKTAELESSNAVVQAYRNMVVDLNCKLQDKKKAEQARVQENDTVVEKLKGEKEDLEILLGINREMNVELRLQLIQLGLELDEKSNEVEYFKMRIRYFEPSAL